MNKEILDTLNELTKKPITELALSYMELVTDNMVKDKEIERLNNIINELEKWLEDYVKLFDNPDTYEEGTKDMIEEVLDKLKELKECR